MVDDPEVMDSLEAALESGECYTLSDAGPLGARTAVGYLGKFWREFSGPEQWEECIGAIALNMEREQYWPEVIYVNDHGNVMSVDIGAEFEEAGLEWPSVCPVCLEPIDYCHGHGDLG